MARNKKNILWYDGEKWSEIANIVLLSSKGSAIWDPAISDPGFWVHDPKSQSQIFKAKFISNPNPWSHIFKNKSQFRFSGFNKPRGASLTYFSKLWNLRYKIIYLTPKFCGIERLFSLFLTSSMTIQLLWVFSLFSFRFLRSSFQPCPEWMALLFNSDFSTRPGSSEVLSLSYRSSSTWAYWD